MFLHDIETRPVIKNVYRRIFVVKPRFFLEDTVLKLKRNGLLHDKNDFFPFVLLRSADRATVRKQYIKIANMA